MSKITVKNNIKYKNQELQLVLESATSNDIRSSVNLVSPNDIAIQNTNTQRKFCLARNEDIFKEHKIKLYTDDGTTKYFAKKGTRPTFRKTLTGVISNPGEYTFSIDSNFLTTIKGPNNLSLSISEKIFYLLLNGSGEVGGGSYRRDEAWIMWESWAGNGGRSGSAVLLMVDMTKIKTFKVKLGLGQKYSADSTKNDYNRGMDQSKIDGEDTTLEKDNLILINLKGFKYSNPVDTTKRSSPPITGGNIVNNLDNTNHGILLSKRFLGVHYVKKTFVLEDIRTEDEKSVVRQYGENGESSTGGVCSIFSNGGSGGADYNDDYGTSGENGSGGGGAGKPNDTGEWFLYRSIRGGFGGNGAFQIFY